MSGGGTSVSALRRAQRERDWLATRVKILEAALAGIEREAEKALDEPCVAWVVTQRVGSLARQSSRSAVDEVPSVEPPFAGSRIKRRATAQRGPRRA